MLRGLLPPLSLAVLLIAIFWLQPRTMSYFGLNLLLNLAVPIALATIAQMFILCVNELDLSHRRLRVAWSPASPRPGCTTRRFWACWRWPG